MTGVEHTANIVCYKTIFKRTIKSVITVFLERLLKKVFIFEKVLSIINVYSICLMNA